MKLSQVVAYLNLLDSLDIEFECNDATAKLKHINYVVTQQAEQYASFSNNISKKFNEIVDNISKFSAEIELLKQHLQFEIIQNEQEYLNQSLLVYREEMIHDTVDGILNRRLRINGDDDAILRNKLRNLTDWRFPGMIIRPGLETYIEDMVPMDPLYVVDHDPELIQPAINKFTPEYQRRLCEYVINDWVDGPILGQLPDNQFGAIFAYHYFNHKPIPVICQYLEEFYQKLRPGGSVIMTYNNCDLAHGVIRAEHIWMLYTPRRLIESYSVNIGFELIEAYDGKGEANWLILRKPGDLTSLRGGQTLAKMVVKTD
jgi:SAM-dependent methyltransferase